MRLTGLASSGQLLVNIVACEWPTLRYDARSSRLKGEQHQPRGMGGRIAVYPVSGHQCRAKAMLKCSSIVCLSSFVCLTNEVYSDTGWETGREGENPTMAAGAAGQLIFAQQLLWQASDSPSTPPPEEKGQLSPHKWLCYRHINPRLTPPTYLCPPIPIPLLLPANPFSAGQLPRCILATCDIVEVKLKPIVWMQCVCMLSLPTCSVPDTRPATLQSQSHFLLWWI